MAGNINRDVLANSKKNKQLIGMREYGNNDDFIVGYTVAFNDSLLAYHGFSVYGYFDGLYIVQIDNIESLEFDSAYLKAYQFLVGSKSGVIDSELKKISLPKKANWQTDLLSTNLCKNKIITVDVGDTNSVNGFIIDFDEFFFSIKVIHRLGEEDGVIVFRTNEINSLRFETPEIKKRRVLFEWRQANTLSSPERALSGRN